VLMRTGIDRESLRVIAWFGPRGLSTLLLVLLPVFAGIPGSEQLFTICCLVVLLSVLLHGSAIGLIIRRAETPGLAVGAATAGEGSVPSTASVVGAPPSPSQLATSTNGAAGSNASDGAEPPELVTIEEMQELQRAGEPVVILDVRTPRTFDIDHSIARGAVRMPPDDAVRLARAQGIPWKATLVAYCA